MPSPLGTNLKVKRNVRRTLRAKEMECNMDLFEKRVNELENETNAIEASKRREHSEMLGDYFSVDSELFDKWKVKVKSLIVSLCGIESEFYKEFINAEEPQSYESLYERFKRVRPIFDAIKEDYRNGYLQKAKILIQAEVFSEQIEQAEELFSTGYYIPAAIIIGIVLETKLRELVIENDLEINKLDRMNADLAKKGVYNSLVQKQITAIAAIRNSAAHGKYEEFSKDQVKNMISQVISLLTII